jgi:hypothetical protein
MIGDGEATQVSEENEILFGAYVLRKGNPSPLIQTHLNFIRLLDEIVVPYCTSNMFIVDGASLTITDVDRMKLIRQKEGFNRTYHDLHHSMRWGDMKKQELYAKQYQVRLEALLREGGEDITTQAMRAFSEHIKPNLDNYSSAKESILTSARDAFVKATQS